MKNDIQQQSNAHPPKNSYTDNFISSVHNMKIGRIMSCV